MAQAAYNPQAAIEEKVRNQMIQMISSYDLQSAIDAAVQEEIARI